jgi:hypothetical protein
VLAVCLGVWMRQVRERKELIAWIQKNGGYTTSRYEKSLKRPMALGAAMQVVPNTLNRLLAFRIK